MKTTQKLEIGAINISLPPPHSPSRYIDLLRKAYSLKKKAKLQGDWIGLIGSLKIETDTDGHEIATGDFYKYIDLDSTRDWYNIHRGEPADTSDLERINIPEELKPHFQFLPFIFFSKQHRMVVTTKDKADRLSIRQAKKILEKAINSEPKTPSSELAEITIEPERETLEKILSAPRIRKLKIEITPPNADDFQEIENLIFQGMNEERVGKKTVEYKEADSRGLAPTENTKQIARVAQSNGKVEGVIGSRGKQKLVSTTDHPFRDTVDFDPTQELRTTALYRGAKSLINRLLQKPKN